MPEIKYRILKDTIGLNCTEQQLDAFTRWICVVMNNVLEFALFPLSRARTVEQRYHANQADRYGSEVRLANPARLVA